MGESCKSYVTYYNNNKHSPKYGTILIRMLINTPTCPRSSHYRAYSCPYYNLISSTQYHLLLYKTWRLKIKFHSFALSMKSKQVIILARIMSILFINSFLSKHTQTSTCINTHFLNAWVKNFWEPPHSSAAPGGSMYVLTLAWECSMSMRAFSCMGIIICVSACVLIRTKEFKYRRRHASALLICVWMHWPKIPLWVVSQDIPLLRLEH